MNSIIDLLNNYDFVNTPKYKIVIFMEFIKLMIKEKNEVENRSKKISL